MNSSPIRVPAEWNDSGVLLFAEACPPAQIPQRTVCDQKTRGIGPWRRLCNGRGYSHMTASETRHPVRRN
jgi:hypothetical protein